MATSDSTSPARIPTAVPEVFHYETKYIVLHFLGRLPINRLQDCTAAQGDSQSEREQTRGMKEQIEEELRQLEDHITSSSCTGFDHHTSLVFRPTNPETSVEDCLAELGDRLARELDTHLETAVQTLLSEPLEYQQFRDTALELSKRTGEGWRKVLGPLLLLQALQNKGHTLQMLLYLGVHYLEEFEAECIIQQGGYGELFGLGSEEERSGTIAEDSNDIYILSAEQPHEQLSLPASLLSTCDNSSEQNSWQTESLPVSLAGHESWAQVSVMDPEDVKSLDSNEGGALAEERSENNSSNSDIVHVEREEAELLEDGGEVGAIEESMMSVIDPENELPELREEFRDQTLPALVSLQSDISAPASLISLEEPVIIGTPGSLSTEPAVISEQELPPPVIEAPAHSVREPVVSLPIPTVTFGPETEPEPSAIVVTVPAEVTDQSLPREVQPTTSRAQTDPGTSSEQVSELIQELVSLPPQPEVESEAEPEPPLTASLVTPVQAPVDEPQVQPEPELPVLLYGGAALMALAAVMAYSVISYRRK